MGLLSEQRDVSVNVFVAVVSLERPQLTHLQMALFH